MKMRILLIVSIVICGIFILGWWFIFEGHPTPTPQQLAWQKLEFGTFIHFGMPTFLGEYGVVGDPKAFNPDNIDVGQWINAVIAMGAKYAILTAQHADGFLLWQSDLYNYGVRQSSWKNGKGDLVREFVDECRKRGIKPGIYLNIADNAYFGVKYPGIVKEGINSPQQRRYNRIVEQMVTEICSNYGELVELWFDGGVLYVEDGGPNIAGIIKRLQPNAMVMKGEDASTIRLSGGETGMVGSPCYYTAQRYYSMGQGDPNGKLWLPVECDSPIRKKQWFWKEQTEDKLFKVEDLIWMYNNSVGNNGNLLLNINPDIDGRVPYKDMELYREFGEWIQGGKYSRVENILPVRTGQGDAKNGMNDYAE